MRRFVAIVLLVVPLALRAQTFDAAKFEEFVERQMAHDRTVGLSVAVLRGDELWARGFGYADLENEVKATERSAYRMASVSKPMTAVAALRLAESGKLDLDADIRRYVPHFPDKGKTITIRQLLAHLGGISHYRNYEVEGNIRTAKSTREAIEIFSGFDLVSDPGAAYNYTTYGYNLVGAAIEGATGRPYGEVVRELVWQPAGMTSTRLDSPTELIPFRVTGYRFDGGEIRRSDYVDISSRFAGGGARSTVVDMVRFARAIYDGKLLREETVDAMWRPAQTTARRYINYGLGWNTFGVNGHFYVSHSGSQQEARTLLMVWPQQKTVIAFASNFEDIDFDPYRIYLYWLVTGEVWTGPPYASDPLDRLAIAIADRAIDGGGFYFEKKGRPMTASAREVQRAFDFINDAYRSASKDRAAAEKRIAGGMHPANGEPVLIAGSWIASKLAESGSRDALARQGGVAALARYVALGARPRLDRDLERRVTELAHAWSAVWTDDARALIVDPPAGDDYREAVSSYRGLRIAPNHAAKLVEEVESNFARGDLGAAERAAVLASDIYPFDDAAAGTYGVLLAVKGDAAGAEKWLRRSAEVDANGYGSPRRLAGIARRIASMGKRDAAGSLLRVASRIHPSSEDLTRAQAELAASR